MDCAVYAGAFQAARLAQRLGHGDGRLARAQVCPLAALLQQAHGNPLMAHRVGLGWPPATARASLSAKNRPTCPNRAPAHRHGPASPRCATRVAAAADGGGVARRKMPIRPKAIARAHPPTANACARALVAIAGHRRLPRGRRLEQATQLAQPLQRDWRGPGAHANCVWRSYPEWPGCA